MDATYVVDNVMCYMCFLCYRRYGVVDGKFCFEGGSRCNKGEGLHVLVSDTAEDIERAVRLASQSKLFTRRRIISRNMSCE